MSNTIFNGFLTCKIILSQAKFSLGNEYHGKGRVKNLSNNTLLILKIIEINTLHAVDRVC